MSVPWPHGVWHLRCNNPGPMTLSGTNTYVVRLVGAEVGDVAVVDPGPAPGAGASAHLAAVVDRVRSVSSAGRVVVLLTHHHSDHVGGVDALTVLLREAGFAVDVCGGGRAGLPAKLGDLQTLSTPGHTRDSTCFLLRRASRGVLFSGDTLLGGSSSFIAHPDGDLTAYLSSLDALAARLADTNEVLLAPGHGQTGLDAAAVVEQYREHRQARLDAVRTVLARLGPDATVAEVIAAVYADVDPALRPAVEAVVRAQLEHLRQ